MAMPLTIIGSQFYSIYTAQESQRKRIRARAKLNAAAKCIVARSKSSLALSKGHIDDLSTGIEHLCLQTSLDDDHVEVVSRYSCISHSDIVSFSTREQFDQFAKQHQETMNLMSLYMHQENEKEHRRQKLLFAKENDTYNIHQEKNLEPAQTFIQPSDATSADKYKIFKTTCDHEPSVLNVLDPIDETEAAVKADNEHDQTVQGIENL